MSQPLIFASLQDDQVVIYQTLNAVTVGRRASQTQGSEGKVQGMVVGVLHVIELQPPTCYLGAK